MLINDDAFTLELCVNGQSVLSLSHFGIKFGFDV